MTQKMERNPPELFASNYEALGNGSRFLDYPGKDKRLVLLGDDPLLVAETPEHLLDDDTTPTEKFFIRNNGRAPARVDDPDVWTIRIGALGEAEGRHAVMRLVVCSRCRPRACLWAGSRPCCSSAALMSRRFSFGAIEPARPLPDRSAVTSRPS